MSHTLLPRANPPWEQLGDACAVVGGSARRYRVDRFAGPLSLKTVLCGSAEFRTRHGRYVVRPGQALIVNAGSAYSMRIDSREPVTTLSVFLPRGVLAGALAARGRDACIEDGDDPAMLERAHTLSPALLAALRRLDDWRVRAPHDPAAGVAALRAACDGWATLVLAERRAIARCAGRSAAHRLDLYRRLCRAIDYLEAHCHEHLGVALLAQQASLSPFHFVHACRRCFGQTPMALLREYRLQRARELLREGSLSVRDVAARVGYASPASFTHLYRRRYGSAPGTMRNRKPGHARPT
jgi:AraC-like DNA-binding protein